MHTTDLDEYVEGLDNVVAWDYDHDEGVARIFVSEKVPESELEDEQLVANALSALGVETDVVSVGGEFTPEVLDPTRHPALGAMSSGPKNRHRPVVDGVSEINEKSTAATAGWFEAEVADPTLGQWADVQPGDVVRLSNNHVYARSNEAELGEPIIQPSPYDGGSLPDDHVGDLVGYVSIVDGVTVDIAARSVSDADSEEKHDLAEKYGQDIRRDYSGLKFSTLIKTGRTTGVTTGTVMALSATANVRYPTGVVKVRDCLLTDAMSQGGDSGSDVFHESSGDYVGAVFAGSPSSTLICKASNIEDELGVELLPTGGDTGDTGSGWWEWLRRLFEWFFGG